ncbi:MAG: outer membrane beta-barrel protein [Bacteroidales bacterium]
MRLSRIVLVWVIGLVLCIPFLSSAQSRKVENNPAYDYQKYHFGFILAMNQMHFVIKPLDNLNYLWFDSISAQEINSDSARLFNIESDPTMGFTVGIVGNLRMGKYFDLRFVPSLSFGERNIDYRISSYRNGVPEDVVVRKNIPSTFVEFPLHMKYKSRRLNNFRAYVLGGVNYRMDLASQAKKRKESGQVIVKLNQSDLYYELGMGFDFYFEWFKFGTELKMSYGLSDVLKRENNIYTDGIESMKSKIFQLSFTFE